MIYFTILDKIAYCLYISFPNFSAVLGPVIQLVISVFSLSLKRLSLSLKRFQPVSEAAQPVSVCRPGFTASLTVQSYEEHAALANKTAENTLFRPLFSPLFLHKNQPHLSTKRTFGLRTSDVLVFFYNSRTISKYNIIIYYYIIFELFYTILFFLHRPSPFPLKF